MLKRLLAKIFKASLIPLLLLFGGVPAWAVGVAEFPIPTPNSRVTGLLAGPDGNLWFTETAGNKVGYITPQGIIREFSLPIANSQPNSLAVGPDGNLWFGESAPARIARISPAGAITEFPLPDAAIFPSLLTLGPDNEIWFATTKFVGNYPMVGLGRISMQGVIRTLQVSDDRPDLGGFYIQQILPDRKNNILYFATFPNYALISGRIYRATASGELTIVGYGSPRIEGIELDGNGDIWFVGSRIHDTLPDGMYLSKISGGVQRTLRSGYFTFALFKAADGAVWITSTEANGEYVVARADESKRYVVGSSGFPRLAEELDGDFWCVTSDAANLGVGLQFLQRIGRLKSDGAYTEFNLAGGLRYTSLTKGSDKNFWFVDRNRNSIGRFTPDAAGATVAVSSASYAGGALAPESIATLFGSGLAATTASAASLPLPKTLAGSQVKLIDQAGGEQLAPLFYASPGQINFLVPAGLRNGTATVQVIGGSGQILASGSTIIAELSPGLFSANATGQGVAAAVLLRILPNGTQRYEPVWQRLPNGQVAPVPIEIPSGHEVYLILFGTGLRGAKSVASFLGVVPSYIGPQGDYAGLDQVNLRLMPIRSGEFNLILTLADGELVQRSNTVTISFK